MPVSTSFANVYSGTDASSKFSYLTSLGTTVTFTQADSDTGANAATSGFDASGNDVNGTLTVNGTSMTGKIAGTFNTISAYLFVKTGGANYLVLKNGASALTQNSSTEYQYNSSFNASDLTALNTYAAANVADTTAPTATFTTPADAATDIATSGNLVLTFSETVTGSGAGNVLIKKVSDNSTVATLNASAATIAGSGASTTATLAYTGLANSTAYYVTVASGAFADAAGNSYAGATTTGTGGWDFTTVAASDTTAPTVASVTSTTANGSYKAGDTVAVTVTFSEAVTVTGTPQLTLETGTTDQVVNYTSGSGTDTLTFTYTVQAGNTSSDLDYAATTSLDLNSGTIADAAGNNATLTLASPAAANSLAANKAIVIDTTAPTATFTTPADAATSIAVNGNVVLTFSETVTGSGAGNVLIKKVSDNSTVATLNASAATIAGSGASTTATLAYTGLANSTAYYVTVASGAFSDAAGNSYAGATTTGTGGWDFTTVAASDTTAPTVASVTSTTANGSYKAGDTVAVTVTFSEAVTVTGTPQLTLETGTTDQVVDYTSGSGTNTLTFTYTVQAGDTSSDLDYAATTSLALNGGTIADAAGNNATRTLAAPAAANSLAANKAIVIDTTAPTATFTTPADAATSIAVNGNVVLTFSETVTGSGTGNILIKKVSDNSTVATLNASAATIAGSGASTTATLAYTGLANNTDYYVTVASGAFSDAAGNSYAGATTTGTGGWDFTTVAAAPEPADPAPAPPPPPAQLAADLNKSSDTGSSNNDRITGDIKPNFDINAGNLLSVGQTARLIDPSGQLVSSTAVTAADVTSGKVTLPTRSTLDDGSYTYKAQIVDGTGRVVGESLVTIQIVTDKDGIMPSVELAANGGDFNKDGKADWEQSNVTQLPLMSLADFQKGKDAPQAAFGAMMVGRPDLAAPAGVKLNDTAQLVDVKLVSTPTVALPTTVVATSPMFAFTVEAQEGKTLVDTDTTREGLQVQTVISLPKGIKADAFMKFNSASQSWYNYANPSALNGSADGAALRDTNGDGLIDQIVITVTDGGVGDEDGLVNGRVVDPGMLADTGVTVLTSLKDSDGVGADVELAPLNKDFNQDGVPDWDQGGIAQLPLASLDDYLLGKDAPLTSFGTLMVGRVDASVPIGARIDTAGQLEGISLSGAGSSVPAGYRSAAPVIELKAAPAAGAQSLTDVDLTREGLQTQVIQYFAAGIKANAYLLFDPTSKTWFDYTDPSAFNGSADGAALVDANNDGLIDAVVITLTDNGIGDDDVTVNGVISLHGMLGWYGA